MRERRSEKADGPVQTEKSQRLRPSGGYRKLRSFQVTTIIYDATVSFCARFLDRRSRTVDQMVQAARSGRQNIAEGSRASAISSNTELRLVNVARASLDELLLDYEDFLRQRGKRRWDKNDRDARAVRTVGREHPSGAEDAAYSAWLNHADPAVVANAVICLIHQANYLLDQQISALERNFIHEGGYSENLAAARLAERGRQREKHRTDPSDPTDPSDDLPPPPPACPACGEGMVLRTARKGARAGSRFWGCADYPRCTGTRPLDAAG
jgi:restriction system protein